MEPNSPAGLADLRPYVDYIIGADTAMREVYIPSMLIGSRLCGGLQNDSLFNCEHQNIFLAISFQTDRVLKNLEMKLKSCFGPYIKKKNRNKDLKSVVCIYSRWY